MTYVNNIIEGIDAFPEPNMLHKIVSSIAALNTEFSDGRIDETLWFAKDVETVDGTVTYYHHADGGGNDWDAIFLPDGSCVIFGFDHETDEAETGDEQPALEGLPEKFIPHMNQDFLLTWDDTIHASIAFWWDADDDEWNYNQKYVNNNYVDDDGGFNYFFEDIIDFNEEKYVHDLVNEYELDENKTSDMVSFLRNFK